MGQLLPVAVILIISAIGMFLIAWYGDIQINQEIQNIERVKNDKLRLLTDMLDSNLKNAVNLIEVTRNLPIVKDVSHSEFISETTRGIPEDKDLKKRILARDILDKYAYFEFITFNMPNGDFYMMEPYSSQLNLPYLNFANRDWYKGVMKTNDTYVSEVYISGTLGHNVVAVRTPVFDDGSMVGIWGGSLSLTNLGSNLKKLELGKNEQVFFIDQNWNVIADSSESVTQSGLAHYPYSEFIESIHDMETKTSVTTVSGTKMHFIYGSVDVPHNKWLIVIQQPSSDVFHTVDVIRAQIYLDIVLLTIVMSASYVIFRMLHSKKILVAKIAAAYNETMSQRDKLIKIDKIKEEFSAMITHELKTPLVPIIGYCKMLRNQMMGQINEEQMDSILTIEKNAKRLETLITDIMDVRKLDMNKMKFTMEDLSIADFFVNLESSYKQVLAEQGKEFITDIPMTDHTIQTDKIRLRQVFDNLISNAIKFTPDENGKITVGWKIEGNKIIFYIRDNGIGISLESQQNLFQKFYQVDTSARRKISGTGLGLAISKGIVEKLGGRIWVESDGKTGTVFYVEFNI
ncbi:sensor histidine kinase [Candidatus Nitrosotenuis chungbukensis]|uniref:sensor histidine kinase n=2 Tax=Candidatus Nitrosotenuis chungbukensis TaxID=1353246 RepID=UPI000693E8E5|nr:sensor histidine kinase [Candidatus Nitrosotenuis chungbukensis]